MSLINKYFSIDHDRLDCLYFEFKQRLAQQDQLCVQYFDKFSKDLIKHIVWEEEVLFPFFEEKSGITCGPTKVMCSEHKIIKSLLSTISDKINVSDFSMMDEFGQLESILEEHNHKEEHILYPMIDKLCDASQTAKLFLAIS